MKEEYLSRSVEDLTQDMQRLAPRVRYLAQVAEDVIKRFNKKNVNVTFLISQIMNTLPYKF